MAIQCTKCGNTLSGPSSLHLVSKCTKCGNAARELFIRVDDKDINPAKYEEDKEWLEAHKED